MTSHIAFWDSSALTPLCLHEAASARARSYARKFEQVVWWGARLEVHGAICRLHRAMQIADLEREGAVKRLQLLTRTWREMGPTDELRAAALEVLDRHSLRAADSLQLAAALIWCNNRPARRTFVCGDRRLASAARATGFTVFELA